MTNTQNMTVPASPIQMVVFDEELTVQLRALASVALTVPGIPQDAYLGEHGPVWDAELVLLDLEAARRWAAHGPIRVRGRVVVVVPGDGASVEPPAEVWGLAQTIGAEMVVCLPQAAIFVRDLFFSTFRAAARF